MGAQKYKTTAMGTVTFFWFGKKNILLVSNVYAVNKGWPDI